MKKLAVLISARDAQKTLPAAVESILQSKIPLDVYVVDDGSKVPVKEILLPLPSNVYVIRLKENKGIPIALNTGLKEILKKDYLFIGRMDADDISLPGRFEKQLQFLEQYPDIMVVGSAARFFPDDDRETTLTVRRLPTEDREIKNYLAWDSAFIHPTTVFRREVFDKGIFYDETLFTAEDYEIFRHIAKYYRLANLPDILLDMRRSSKSISKTKTYQQRFNRLRVQLRYFNPLQPIAWVGLLRSVARVMVPTSVVKSVKQYLGMKAH